MRVAMTAAEVWELTKNGGPPVILLLMLAVGWLNSDRKRLLESLSAKDRIIESKSAKLESLSERTLVLMTELKMRWFTPERHP